MCTEHTPILACVLPAFDSLLSTWTRMRREPSKLHLRKMIDTAVEKMASQYNERRFSKPYIISIGMCGNFFGNSLLIICSPVLHPSLRFKWIERNWPANQIAFAKRTILTEVRESYFIYIQQYIITILCSLKSTMRINPLFGQPERP
jgi:hypothetical protein